MAITDPLCQSWLDLHWHFDPVAGTAAGVPGALARLGSFDLVTVREHLAAARAIAGAVEELPLEAVTDEIDRTALLAEIRARVARFEHDQPHVRDPCLWLDHLGHALLQLELPAHDREAHALAVLGRLRAVPEFLAAARDTVRRPPIVLAEAAIAMAPTLTELVHELVEQNAPHLQDQPGELAAAATEAEAALTRLRMALVGDIVPDHDPHGAGIGEERYAWLLHHAFMLRTSPGEAWRWGQAMATEVEADLERLAAELEPGRPWQDVFESQREAALVTGDLLAATTEALVRAREATRALGLLIHREGEIEVREAPTWLAMLAPFVAYHPPPPLPARATGRLFVAAPTAPADLETAAWQRGELDAHRLAVLAAHDGWPGRHAQAVAAGQASSLVRRSLASPIMVAGWGCYAEELMVVEEAHPTPAEQLAQRVLLLLRALRLVIGAGIHTRRLTPAAAVDLLMERVPMDHHAALAEVRRVCAEPGAASVYALGRRELLELRDAWRRQAGATAPIREFHEAVFSHGRVPPALVRWGMGLE